MTDEPTSGTDSSDDGASLTERTRQLHRHLEATAELPIDHRANRWLGEAEAIAADVAASDLDEATVRERVAKVRRLLAEVDGTGHADADDHLEAALDRCEAILEGGDDRRD